MALQRIDVRHADPAHLAAVAARAAATIGAGGLVVLPTETVYGVAADPRQPRQLDRVLALKGRAAEHALTHHLARTEDAAALGVVWTPAATRLARRYWPGPLTLIARTRAGSDIGLRVPAHSLTQAVIAACGPSLFLTSVNRTGEPPLLEPDAIAAAFSDRLDLLVDAGPPPLRVASTVVRTTGDEPIVLREGILTAAEILDTAAHHTLFVCTGNTCRSPMAEALARRMVGARLGIPDDRVLARGQAFASAGVFADDGDPASPGAIEALAERGIDLSGHRSRSLDPAMIERAEVVYCLGAGHRQRVLALAPQAEAKVHLLRPDGEDVADPYGASLARYRAVRDELEAALADRLRDR